MSALPFSDKKLPNSSATFKLGAGITVTGVPLYNVGAGFNVILKNKLYLRAGAQLAFGGGLKTPSSIVSHTVYDLRVGYNSQISESFRIVPYAGIGYQFVLSTTRTPVNVIDDFNQLGGLVDIEIETRYETQNTQSFCAPIGVDFHFNNGKIGFVVGYYYSISNYTETGLRLGFTFGRQ